MLLLSLNGTAMAMIPLMTSLVVTNKEGQVVTNYTVNQVAMKAQNQRALASRSLAAQASHLTPVLVVLATDTVQFLWEQKIALILALVALIILDLKMSL